MDLYEVPRFLSCTSQCVSKCHCASIPSGTAGSRQSLHRKPVKNTTDCTPYICWALVQKNPSDASHHDIFSETCSSTCREARSAVALARYHSCTHRPRRMQIERTTVRTLKSQIILQHLQQLRDELQKYAKCIKMLCLKSAPLLPGLDFQSETSILLQWHNHQHLIH